MSKFLMNATKSALAAVTALSVGMVNVQAESEKQADENGKDETVYIITDAAGSKQSVIVSDWLKNTDGSTSITDESSLKDIENVSGDESFTKNADGTITWDAEGKDIYYQGTTDKELPVEVKISYELDGKPVTAEELAGKSGHVKVHFDYINNTEETVAVNGKNETVKIPFAMITGMKIDQDKFSNIEVTNGKVISEGKTSFVVGMAFPGLAESLDMDSTLTNADIPEYVEIEADTTDFELGMTMTVAGNNLLENLNLETDGEVSELEDKVNQLVDASKQLEDGTQALKDGTAELKDGTGQLLDGTNTLKDGSSKLKDGASELADGTAKVNDGAGSLKDGAEKVNAGAGQLKEGSVSAAAGADQLAQGTSQLKDGAVVLDAGIAKAQAGAKNLEEGAKNLEEGIIQTAGGIAQIKTSVDAAIETSTHNKELADGFDEQDTKAVAEAQKTLTDKVQAMVQKEAANAYKQGLEAGTNGELLNKKNKEIADLNAEIDRLSNEIAELEAANNSCNSGTITADKAKKAISEENNDAAQQTLNAAPAPESNEEAAEEPTEKPAELTEAAESTEIEAQPQEEAVTAEEPVPAEEPVEDQEVTTETAFHLSDSDASNLIVLMEEQKKSEEEINLEQAIQGFAAAVSNKTQHMTTSKVLDESINSLTLLQGGLDSLYNGITGTESTAGLVAGEETLAAGANKLKKGILVLEGYADETGKTTVDKNGNPLGGLAALKIGAGQLKEGSASAAAGADQLAKGTSQLKDGAAALADGTSALSAGSKELSEGTGKLAEGAGQLKDGTSELDNGVSTLRDGVIKLNDGSAALDDGALELLEGMETFESEGMDKLAEVFGDKLGDIIDRLSALNDAGTSYNNFSGASGSENDSVKFIFKTESVKAE